MTDQTKPRTPSEIATRAEAYKDLFLAVQLAVPIIFHPGAPLLSVYETLLGMPGSAPVEIYRRDETLQSNETMGEILRRVPRLAKPGGIRTDGLLFFAARQGASDLGDDLVRAKLMDARDPLLEFARHFRNACVHGNRWHFRGTEPKNPAELRGRALNASLHGSPALFDWVGPGDYLDFLEDLADLLSR